MEKHELLTKEVIALHQSHQSQVKEYDNVWSKGFIKGIEYMLIQHGITPEDIKETLALEEHNKANVKTGDTIYSYPNKREYKVAVVDDEGVYTRTDSYSFPYTPRLDFKDFKIL